MTLNKCTEVRIDVLSKPMARIL